MSYTSNIVRCLTALTLLATAAAAQVQEKTIKFSGREWVVKDGSRMGPGPNAWSSSSVWVDDKGQLHLKIRQVDGVWQCAEVGTKERLGFGRYQFEVIGRIDKLDKNVVLGLFPYPTRDVGTDGTNEIDIEFARWAIPTAPNGSYTVWPATKGRKQTSHEFEIALTGDNSTHRFTWTSESILFQSLNGHRNDDRSEIARFEFKPSEFRDAIAQQPMPLRLNLWLFRGQPPSDGKEVEVIFKSVQFVPESKAPK